MTYVEWVQVVADAYPSGITESEAELHERSIRGPMAGIGAYFDVTGADTFQGSVHEARR